MLLGLILAYTSLVAGAEPRTQIEFDRDVRPILSDRCYACHGPDSEERQADLRLDMHDGAFGTSSFDDSMSIIRPGDLEHSELYRAFRRTTTCACRPPIRSCR